MKRNVTFSLGSILLFTVSFFIGSCNTTGQKSNLTHEDSLAIARALCDSTNGKTGTAEKSGNGQAFALTQLMNFSPEHPGGEPIRSEKADTLITRFRTFYPDRTSPMRGDNQENLHGFFINRDAIKHLFGDPKTKNCNGFMVYFGKKDYKPYNVCTVVLMPTEMDLNPGGTGRDYPEFSWEEVDPCPQRCGEGERVQGSGDKQFGKPWKP